MTDEPTSGVEAVVRSALEHVMSEALRCQKDGGFIDPYWLETAIRPAALRIRAGLAAPAPTPLRFLMDRNQLREQIASKPDIHDTVEGILTDGLEQIVLTATSDEADRLSRCLETARATLGFAASARKRAALATPAASPTSGVEAVAVLLDWEKSWVRQERHGMARCAREAATALSTLAADKARAEVERDEARAQFDAHDELLHQVITDRNGYRDRAAAAEAASAAKDERIRELGELLKPFAEAGRMAGISGRPPGEHVDANAFDRVARALTQPDTAPKETK